MSESSVTPNLTGTDFLGSENIVAAMNEAEARGIAPKDVLAEWVTLGRTVLAGDKALKPNEPTFPMRETDL
jgi:hypothetical protein